MITKKRFEEIICSEESLTDRIDSVWDELCTLSEDVAVMKDYDQHNPYHCYDLRIHTTVTVDQVRKEGLTDEEYRLIKIAAFFHDIGKPATMTEVRDEEGNVLKRSFGGHPQVSRALSDPILRKLGYTREMELLRFYIGCHDMFMHFMKPEKVPPESRLAINAANVARQVRRWTARHKPTAIGWHDFYVLTWLCEADGMAHAEYVVTAKGTDSRAEIVDRVRMIRGILKTLMENDHSIESIRHEMNFRELGGYPVADSKVIQGIFFRSGALGDLTKEELEIVHQQGIRTIIDLRSEYEREMNPDPVLEDAQYYPISAFVDEDGNELNFSPEAIRKATGIDVSRPGESSMGAFLKYMYQSLVFGSKAYHEMFDAMLEERVPMLIHCTAGKDRTGVGSMLILMALGADERVLRKDYMITNTYRWDAVQRFLDARKDEIGDNEELRNAMIAYEGVREEAVDILLQTILGRYESIEAYLEGEFGLDDLALQQLQEMYLA